MEDTTNFDYTQISKGEMNTMYIDPQGIDTWVFSVIDETLQEINGSQDPSKYAMTYTHSEDDDLSAFEYNGIYGLPVYTLPFSISNYHDYAFYLDYIDSAGNTQTKEWHVSMDFSDIGALIQSNVDEDRIEFQFLNDFYFDSGVVTENMPSIDVNDSTNNFFSWLVNGIVDSLTEFEDNETVTFTLFSDTHIINSNDFDWLSSNAQLLLLRNFIEFSWVFAIGFIIYKDLRLRIWRLKEFHWSAVFADDISVDVL